MRDVYDREIAYLAFHPECIEGNWSDGSPLFAYCTPTRLKDVNPNGDRCGCLTLVRGPCECFTAWTDELTREMQADERIPWPFWEFNEKCLRMTPDERIAALQPFAYWQRRLDRELDREVPETFPGETQETQDAN